MSSREQTCKGCGKKVIFARDTEGKIQILDPVPPIFGLLSDLPDGSTHVRRLRGAYVSHFATCPKANEFSRAKQMSLSEGNS